MAQILREKKGAHGFENPSHDAKPKQTFAALESENRRLKELVVRLSETILRNVAGRP
jgi:hypothetical protein